MSTPYDIFKQTFTNIDEAKVFLIFLCTYFGLLLVIYIIHAFAAWRIFTKMGEKGWKALIPFYNLYILTKRVSNGKYFISLLSLTIAALVCSTVLNILSGLNITGVAVTLVNVLSSGISIAAFVIEILLLHKVSKAFGHGGGFTVGLVFLTFIFELILAFGSSQYIGCQDNAEK